jgi:hypothetical protein
MRTGRTRSEIVQIQTLLQENPTFYRVFKDDWTQSILEELRNRLYGKIPRNFVINIGGLVGTSTGIFKSTLGLQLVMQLDPTFTLKGRVAFSINALLDLIRNTSEFTLCSKCLADFKQGYKGTYEEIDAQVNEKCNNCENMSEKQVLLTKLIYFLDEQTRTLKTGGMIRLMNLIDTCRQRQICFILCGVNQYNLHFTTYELRRIQESSDDYLPMKQVRYAVYDSERDIYYGYFLWDITPLTDPKWKMVFDEYAKIKTEFQRVAIAQRTQAMGIEQYAEQIINSKEFQKCFKTLNSGRKVLQIAVLRTVINQAFPDVTNSERSDILSEVKMQMLDEDDDDDGDDDEEDY